MAKPLVKTERKSFRAEAEFIRRVEAHASKFRISFTEALIELAERGLKKIN